MFSSVIVNKFDKIIKMTNIHKHEKYNNQTIIRKIIKSTLNVVQKKICMSNKFCFVNDDESVFIFTCKINLELFEFSEHVFWDGTMKIFNLLLIILFNFIQFKSFKIIFAYL